MNQLQLPTNLEDLIPEDHLVRVVHSAIEKMDVKPLLARYKGGGTSSYHPKMMLKVLVYAYTQRIYSSRQIAKALRENEDVKEFYLGIGGEGARATSLEDALLPSRGQIVDRNGVPMARAFPAYALWFNPKAMGEDGYLPERGLIPLADEELKKVQADVKAMTPPRWRTRRPTE